MKDTAAKIEHGHKSFSSGFYWPIDCWMTLSTRDCRCAALSTGWAPRQVAGSHACTLTHKDLQPCRSSLLLEAFTCTRNFAAGVSTELHSKAAPFADALHAGLCSAARKNAAAFETGQSRGKSHSKLLWALCQRAKAGSKVEASLTALAAGQRKQGTGEPQPAAAAAQSVYVPMTRFMRHVHARHTVI